MPGAQTAALTTACKSLSLSLSLFFFWSSEAGTGAAQEDMTVNAHPSSSLLPSGVKQPFWLMEEMNHYSTWG